MVVINQAQVVRVAVRAGVLFWGCSALRRTSNSWASATTVTPVANIKACCSFLRFTYQLGIEFEFTPTSGGMSFNSRIPDSVSGENCV